VTIAYTCDHCRGPIDGGAVAYAVSALGPHDTPMSTVHLHWQCLPGFGRLTHAVLTWDWREQPDLGELHQAVNRLAGLHVEPVETGSDQYAVVISSRDLSREDYQRIYEENQRVGS
jgi:hypothetical protein